MIPQIALLTQWPPDAKYKMLRRYAEHLPPARFIWVSLQATEPGAVTSFRHASFLPTMPNWRVRRKALGWWFVHEAQANGLARSIAAWARTFVPDVLWVLPELGVAPVAWRLKKMLGIPMHVTSHDAHETARELVPTLYYPFYARSVRRVLDAADSLDAVSESLVEHHVRTHHNLGPDNTLVFPPSVRAQEMTAPAYLAAGGSHRLVRIGLCGSMRVTAGQWSAFLALLGTLPFRFDVMAFAYEDLFPESKPPANVRISKRPFAETEADLIREFHKAGVEACYLGLFKERDRRLFSQTSLSSKLTTYLQAGLPVIVDGPEDSAGWQLMKPYGAGVLFDGDANRAIAELIELFGNRDTWRRKAVGAQKLCRERLDLGTNMEKFRELLARTARKRVNSEE